MAHRRAVVFPGQGTAGGEVSGEVAEALSRRVGDGEPPYQLAVFANSVDLFYRMREAGVEPDLVAGHSLGEYAALVAAGALDPGDAFRLVRRRGELMQEHGAGAMAAVLGLPPEAVAAIAVEAGAEVANFNAPEQTVVSGRADAVERAMALARERGAKRALPLPVSAAFHSSLMAPVVDALGPMIDATAFQKANVPLIGNVDARPLREPDDLRRELRDQICAPVRWVEVVRALTAAGVTTFYEVGPGKVLAGLIPRCAPGATVISAESLLTSSAPSS
jgi:[acyl-carrier-protein] S-malonyltransferase